MGSSPIYFYMRRYSSLLFFNTANTPILFDTKRLNGATGWNLFIFIYTGFAQFPPSSDVYLGVGLFLNGNVIGWGWGRANNVGTAS